MRRRWELLWRAVGSTWRVALLAVAFGVGLWALSYFYLVPAMEGYRAAGESTRRMIRAVSWLLLAVVLAMLAIGVWWSIRRQGRN
ncbi:hypothetical protein [Cyanobium sp. Cruz-8H5]|uniref:hypothetical protein n=1 Tax=Cyanobium sp. Cruz-8H5 TaxID=2823712 RepID=UPI0020CED09F|nr:hypothetical protein [Cyanobium sp. Cruz-8H5]MCP9861435.1 hypothetical protein [Cyanobium sp. Cruz-8H5]